MKLSFWLKLLFSHSGRRSRRSCHQRAMRRRDLERYGNQPLPAWVETLETRVLLAANLVMNGGFETADDTSGPLLPVAGDWHGDVTAIVGTQDGITPVEGSKMLVFLGSHEFGNPSSSAGSQARQVIDLSAYSAQIAAGGASVTGSAFFNRISGDSQTDTLFSIGLIALDGSLSD
jgi:hypothetical protein